MSEPLRVALAGLGTVGGGVIRLLDANRELIARRAGREIEIVAVSARDRSKDRGVDLTRFAWVDDTTALAKQPGADVVVELIGGSDGPALTLARSTLGAGRSFVTANKAMIAHHGLELAQAAESAGVALKFEAAALGYRVRLLGLAEAGADGLFQRVHPHLVPIDHPLAHVTGSLNAVVAEGNFVGRLLFQGAGAGDGPTASAVVADLIDIARGEFGPPFAMPVVSLTAAPKADSGERRGRAYLRFTVADRVGVLAEIAAAMRDAGVSIESLIQRGAIADGSVLVAIVTHESPERSIAQALEKLRGSQSLVGQPMWMHILD